MGEHSTLLLRLLSEMHTCDHCRLTLSGMSAYEKCSPEGLQRMVDEHIAHREDVAPVKKAAT